MNPEQDPNVGREHASENHTSQAPEQDPVAELVRSRLTEIEALETEAVFLQIPKLRKLISGFALSVQHNANSELSADLKEALDRDLDALLDADLKEALDHDLDALMDEVEVENDSSGSSELDVEQTVKEFEQLGRAVNRINTLLEVGEKISSDMSKSDKVMAELIEISGSDSALSEFCKRSAAGVYAPIANALETPDNAVLLNLLRMDDALTGGNQTQKLADAIIESNATRQPYLDIMDRVAELGIERGLIHDLQGPDSLALTRMLRNEAIKEVFGDSESLREFIVERLDTGRVFIGKMQEILAAGGPMAIAVAASMEAAGLDKLQREISAMAEEIADATMPFLS